MSDSQSPKAKRGCQCLSMVLDDTDQDCRVDGESHSDGRASQDVACPYQGRSMVGHLDGRSELSDLRLALARAGLDGLVESLGEVGTDENLASLDRYSFVVE